MALRIDSYDFGRIRVGGEDYHGDLIILPERVLAGWWREEGHRLKLEDLRDVLEEDIEVLVIGTGYYGAMRVSEEVVEELRRREIELIVEPTTKAWRTYNKLVEERRKVAAALHLTC